MGRKSAISTICLITFRLRHDQLVAISISHFIKFCSWTTDTILINGPKFFKDFIIIKIFLILFLLFHYSNLT